jgi:Flp pilus assembly protein TadD
MERAIGLAPSDPAFRLLYGMKLYEQGRFLDAARELRRAQQAGARDPSLPFFLGSAELENGHFAEAERALREAIAAEPARTAARLFLGKLLLLTGRPADARRELTLAAVLDSGSAPVQLDLGRAAEALGDLDAAETAYRRALSMQPSLSRGHYLLGALLSRRRRADEARQEMAIYDKSYQEEQALLFARSSLRVEINLGNRELREGRYADALTRFTRHPDNVEALRGAAAALARLGRHAEAVAALERALDLSPDDRRLRYELGRERQGDRAP